MEESDSDSSVESRFAKCSKKFKKDYSKKLLEIPISQISDVGVPDESMSLIKNSKRAPRKKGKTATKISTRRNTTNKRKNVDTANCILESSNSLSMHVGNTISSRREIDVIVLSDEDDFVHISDELQQTMTKALERNKQLHPITETVKHRLIESLENSVVDSSIIYVPIKQEIADEHSIEAANDTPTTSTNISVEVLSDTNTIPEAFEIIASTSRDRRTDSEEKVTELPIEPNCSEKLTLVDGNLHLINITEDSIQDVNSSNDTIISSLINENHESPEDKDIMLYINSIIDIDEHIINQEIDDRYNWLNKQLPHYESTLNVIQDFDACESHENNIVLQPSPPSAVNDNLIEIDMGMSNNDSDVEIVDGPSTSVRRRRTINSLELLAGPSTSVRRRTRPQRRRQWVARNANTVMAPHAFPIYGDWLLDNQQTIAFQNQSATRTRAPKTKIPPTKPPSINPPENSTSAEKEEQSKTGKVLHDCCICLQPLNGEISSTTCGHVFCTPCIKRAVQTAKCCPTCRARLTLAKIHPLFI